MYALAPGNLYYYRVGLVLLLVQMGVFLFGLPPFQRGIWYQSEPVIAAIFLGAIANAAWLTLGVARNWLIRQSFHPLFLCLLIFITWQLESGSHALSFWRSWFGSPDIGEGTAHYIALLLLIMLAYPLWQLPRSRRLILIATAGLLAAQCALHLLNPPGAHGDYSPGTWAPAKFSDYLAFMAASLWIAAVTGGVIVTRRHYALLTLFTLGVLYISHNKSALVLFPVAFAISALVSHPRLLPYYRRYWRALAIFACWLPMAWVVFCAAYGGSIGQHGESGPIAAMLKKDGSVGSRIALNQVAVSTMRHEPLRWLTGVGWGRFTDDSFKYALVDGVYVFKDGVRRPNWGALEGNAFHSHSQPLEALLSTGLLGMLLWFGLPMIALLTLPESYALSCAPMIAAAVMLSYFWFELPQCLPYDALALVALISVCSTGVRPITLKSDTPALIGLLAAAIAMIWSTGQQIDATTYGQRLRAAIETNATYNDFSLGWLVRDSERGGDRLHATAVGYGLQLAEKHAIDENQRQWYARLLEAAHIAGRWPNAGARLASTELWMDYKLLLDLGGFRSFAPLGHRVSTNIVDSVLLVAHKAPLRDDYATLYLLNLPSLTDHDPMRQYAVLTQILSLAPNHRPAMWLLGNLLNRLPKRKAEGCALTEKAVSLGVDKVYPVVPPP